SCVARGGLDGGPVHGVDIVLTARAVPPHDVGLAIAVEVADALHLPVHVGHRADEPFRRLDARSVHGIDVVLPRARVAPQDVALPVAVEVRDADHFPVEIGDAAQV